MKKMMLVASVLFLLGASAFGDKVLNKIYQFCNNLPSPHLWTTWQQPNVPACSYFSTYYGSGPGTRSCYPPPYLEVDQALPHGLCHIVRDWDGMPSIDMDNSCQITVYGPPNYGALWYIAQSYEY